MATLQDYLNQRNTATGMTGSMTPTSPGFQETPDWSKYPAGTYDTLAGGGTGGLTSTADRSSRAGLEGAFGAARTGASTLSGMPAPGSTNPTGTLPPGSTITGTPPPGGTLPSAGTKTQTGPTGATYPGGTGGLPSGGNVSATQAGLPQQAPLPGQYQANYMPDDPYSSLDYGLGIPKTSITPESVMVDPGFQWQQKQLGNQLEDMFAAKGRVGSTDYFNTSANAQQKMISDEYNRINNQQFERSMQINKLLYDRRYQENVLGYERQFNENVERYGRERAEDILAYERQFREDARDFDQIRWATELGFQAAGGGGGGGGATA